MDQITDAEYVKATVSEAKKRSTTDVFSYKNMAAVEALPVLVAGNGEGMGGVWRLVEATLEVIEEYVPKKDAENNYVGEEREFDF